MAELLLEILSEEIPARMQARAAADLKRLVTDGLTKAGLSYETAESYVTPRRLALVVDGLPDRQPDVTEEKRGPRKDAPDKAVQGFLKGVGLTSIEDAEVRETDKGAFYFAVRQVKGRATAEVLPEVIVESVGAMTWPKSMRWASGHLRWVRPLHSVLAVLGGGTLSGALDLGNHAPLPFGDTTVGHRFLAPEPFRVRGFADYAAGLRGAKVMLDQAERREAILRQAERCAAEAQLTLNDDPALLDEVTGLVEWPLVLMGTIDDRFMDLPPEVLTTSMRAHQKYLALRGADGKLANRFLVVANMETPDKGKAIVAGNERVLRARLADARFFWDQDRKVPLASRTTALGDIVFHEKLGTLDDKVDRVQALAVRLTDHIPDADKDRVRSAARLAKADLVTGMVGEFPELQGIMGRYYARHDGEHDEVAQAIAEHYAPQGPSDACPSAPVSVAVALADKIDTLVGFFAIDEKPTGSKDPYALRRAALGVIRLIVENRLRLPLLSVFAAAADLLVGKLERAFVADIAKAGMAMAHGQAGETRIELPKSREQMLDELLGFFADRLKVALRDKGVRHDLIAAVFAVGGEDDLVRLLARVSALESFLGTEDGEHLLVAYRRAANIVRIEEKRDKTTYDGAVDGAAITQEEETTLLTALDQAEAAAGKARDDEDFTGAMTALSGLRQPVDAFFDHVTVNTDDPALRANRLRLLSRIRVTLDRVALFSKIEG